MAGLTTHVLNVAQGIPAAGVKIVLHRLDSDVWKVCAETSTNQDGRVDQPLLTQEELRVGTYELHFAVGDYFKDKAFLDTVVIQFNVADATQSYHVPLLVTPWSYQVYRGS